MNKVVDLAVQVFGSMKIARCWLNLPRKELDGKSAYDLVREGKIDHVVQILHKISREGV